MISFRCENMYGYKIYIPHDKPFVSDEEVVRNLFFIKKDFFQRYSGSTSVAQNARKSFKGPPLSTVCSPFINGTELEV